MAAIDAPLRALLPPDARATIVLRVLPASARPPSVAPGLLYLPRPYVVPGGRFNEMYGWDSDFILLGLLRDERDLTRARDLVDDALYEVVHYGGVLNANRTFAPVARAAAVPGQDGAGRLRPPAIAPGCCGPATPSLAEHAHWTAPPHLIPATGLVALLRPRRRARPPRW